MRLCSKSILSHYYLLRFENYHWFIQYFISGFVLFENVEINFINWVILIQIIPIFVPINSTMCMRVIFLRDLYYLLFQSFIILIKNIHLIWKHYKQGGQDFDFCSWTLIQGRVRFGTTPNFIIFQFFLSNSSD